MISRASAVKPYFTYQLLSHPIPIPTDSGHCSNAYMPWMGQLLFPWYAREWTTSSGDVQSGKGTER